MNTTTFVASIFGSGEAKLGGTNATGFLFMTAKLARFIAEPRIISSPGFTCQFLQLWQGCERHLQIEEWLVTDIDEFPRAFLARIDRLVADRHRGSGRRGE
jgi:hypothetical protein